MRRDARSLVVIPAWNEVGSVGQVVRDVRLKLADADCVVVDDGSTDGTAEVARQLGVDRIVRHPVNRGLAAAFMTGLSSAVASGADIIVKGVRGVTDFDTEMQMAQMNRHASGILTTFLPATAANGFIASRYIREISKMGGDVTDLVPEPVAEALRERFLR